MSKKERYAIIYHTDKEWFNFLVNKGLTENVNFWTKEKLNINQKHFPFFFKTSDQKIVGYADYLYQEKLTISQAWDIFGPRNGVNDFSDFKIKLKKVLNIDNVEDTNQKIRCTVLTNVIKFEKSVDLKQIGVAGMQTMKYIDKTLSDRIFELAGIFNNSNLEINVSAVEPKFVKSLVKTRAFQSRLREEVLNLYDGKCVICGIDNPELLNVSHIVPVSKKEEYAGKPENTLLLCKLHDAMFDRGLISIDSEGRIVISRKLENTKSEKLIREIEEIKGKKLNIDLSKSRDFIKWHYDHIFDKKL